MVEKTSLYLLVKVLGEGIPLSYERMIFVHRLRSRNSQGTGEELITNDSINDPGHQTPNET